MTHVRTHVLTVLVILAAGAVSLQTAQQLGCLGHPCQADAPPATPPLGWTIAPTSSANGKGYGYLTDENMVVPTCLDCKPCKAGFSYSYSGSGEWSVEGGGADPDTECGHEFCSSGAGPTSGSVSLKAHCNDQDVYFFASGGQLGQATLVCPCVG